jgi:hypothetical protein
VSADYRFTGTLIVFCKGSIGGGYAERRLMLTIKWGPDRSTFLESRRIYVLLRDDTEIGRIEVCAPGRHAIQGHVTVQGSEFQCRIDLRAKPRPRIDRWVMYTGETELHAARCEGIRTFQVDEVPGLGLLRLRLEGLLFGAEFVIDRMPEEMRIGDVRYRSARNFPRPRVPQYQLETMQDLPVTLEIFLSWIVAQCDLDKHSG